jgi:hypothetical protein
MGATLGARLFRGTSDVSRLATDQNERDGEVKGEWLFVTEPGALTRDNTKFDV